jgi:hypothetical protein
MEYYLYEERRRRREDGGVRGQFIAGLRLSPSGLTPDP